MDSSIYKNCSVLVTGGAGFIGSHLTEYLLENGHAVTILDDLSTGSMKNINGLLANPHVKFIEGTILDPELVDHFVAKAELVFHLAAVVGVKNVVDFPRHGIEVNVGGTENILKSASKHRSRVVLASSSEVYGISKDIPFREDGDRVLGPTSVQRWSYAASKALDEHLGLTYSSEGLPVSMVRYFNAYGPRIQESGYGSVIARFISQAFRGEKLTLYGDGDQTRSFTYIADTVRGTYLVGTHPDAIGEIFNIGTEVETSVKDLATEICKLLGVTPEFETVRFEDVFGPDFQDIPRRVPSVEKAGKILGFNPEYSLEKGLKKTIEWAKEHYKSANSTQAK